MTTVPLTDDGYIVLLLTKADDAPGTEPRRIELDTFEEYNALCAVRKAERSAAEAEGRPPAVAEKCRDYLNAKFNLKVSAAFVGSIFNALGDEVDRLQKKDLSAASAATPEPSASPSGRTVPPATPPA